MSGSFRGRCEKIVEEFLQSAVIVDDGAYFDTSQEPALLKTPGRKTEAAEALQDAEEKEAEIRHRLNVGDITDSFAEHGLTCGVIAPRGGPGLIAAAARVAQRADIVLLDWQIDHDNGKQAIDIIRTILTDDHQDDQGGRLRLMAIYTGEQELTDIGTKVAATLKAAGWDFRPDDDHNVVLSLGHTRIVIYAKSDLSLAPGIKDRSVPEAEVPARLIADFAEMVDGLLPSIALASLAAVRANAHKVLDRLHGGLDAAFLSHRACLLEPSDAERHIVQLIAGELHSLMEDAAVANRPAGIEAIKGWLLDRHGPEPEFTFDGGKSLPLGDVLHLLEEGLDTHIECGRKMNKTHLKEKDVSSLSAGLAGELAAGKDPNLQLAWIFNFRTVFERPQRTLQLGTVVRALEPGDGAEFHVCMTPRCESVRVEGRQGFLLLPLAEADSKTKGKLQLVVYLGEESYGRLFVDTGSAGWELPRFTPTEGGVVMAEREGGDGRYLFTDNDGRKFEWLGELKPDFAQRLAHRFGADLSRVGVDNSEWLRRMERIGS